MDPGQLFFDNRHRVKARKQDSGGCTYCRKRAADTKDHVPSRVFLDTPYPQDLPTVWACGQCNQQFSADEQYLACLLECVVCGTTNPGLLTRESIRRSLENTPGLAARLSQARHDASAGLTWEVDVVRLRSIVLKLARGHVCFEQAALMREKPTSVNIRPLFEMNLDDRRQFLNISYPAPFPEIGTRQFLHVFEELTDTSSLAGPEWTVVQPDRYQYIVDSTEHGLSVRMVIRGYLACEVYWAE